MQEVCTALADYTSKPEYRPKSRQYDTSWLPDTISISDSDFYCSTGHNVNCSELKYRTPICTRVQVLQFHAKYFHIVVHPNREVTERGVNFDSPYFDIYCPYSKFQWQKTERGWLLIGQPYRVFRQQAIPILCAEVVWPCCQRHTITDGVATIR